MISYKSLEEIKILREGGKILSNVLYSVADIVKEGVSTKDLDEYAEKLIRDNGGIPAFKNYPSNSSNPFPATLCTSINEEIVHGIPSDKRIIKNGDIISLDIGMQYKGLFTDMAITLAVGDISEEEKLLIERTKNALYKGIDVIKIGGKLSDIGCAIENYIKQFNYGIVRDLVGHGVGHAVHEEPQVANYCAKFNENIIIKEGLVIAIEPMITLGDYRIDVLDDDWTIVSRDRKKSAHWEHTIAVEKDGIIIITDK